MLSAARPAACVAAAARTRAPAHGAARANALPSSATRKTVARRSRGGVHGRTGLPHRPRAHRRHSHRSAFHRDALCSISPYYLPIERGSPRDWLVFMWRIELTCGLPFGRLHPSCISVLSFYRLHFGGYSIFMIARSIDSAFLPSDDKSTMGPGFAVVGTPGSPSDVARTKGLLPCL